MFAGYESSKGSAGSGHGSPIAGSLDSLKFKILREVPKSYTLVNHVNEAACKG